MRRIFDAAFFGLKAWPERSPFRRDLALAMILVAAIFALYSPAFYGGPLFDDNEQSTKPELRSVEGLWRIWTEPGATQQYFPLVHTAFWLEQRIWGDAVLGYHLVNVCLHSAVALLLVRLCRQLRLRGPWLAAFVFALHPVSVESVAWMAEQKNGISTVLYLIAASVYLRFDEDRRASIYLAATALFLLALLSKTTTVVLPPVLAIIAWWRHGSIRWKRDVAPLLPWLAMSVAFGLITISVEEKLITTADADVHLSWLQRAMLAGRVVWFYLGKLFWPADLTLMYPQWRIDPGVVWHYLYSVSIVGVIFGLLKAGVRFRGAAAGLLVFIASLGPFLGFFEIEWFVFGYVADHFQYLAMMGIIVPCAAFVTNLIESAAQSRTWMVAQSAALGLLMTLGVLSFQQSKLYRDAETRYRATLVHNPTGCVAHNNLGTILLKRPNGLAEAVSHFKAAIAIKPDFLEARNNLANAYAMSGQLSAAAAEYEAALQLDPQHAAVHANLANTLLKMPGRERDGIREYEIAVRLQPNFPEAHNGLGSALLNQPGRLADARRHLRTAIEQNPGFAEAYSNLGNALLAVDGFEREAIAEYRKAVAISPDFPEAHYNLGVALLRVNERASARNHLEIARKLRPGWDLPNRLLQQLDSMP